ncbi:MAG: DNA-binding protein [Armatimonadetes bacterium]|nr:DNA-binding protein [Armatimonadota bacterium]
MRIQPVEGGRIVMVRLESHEDVLIALRQAVEESGIRNGVILSGIGSLSRYHVHVVKTTNLPPGDVFWGEEGPYDILNVNGLILDGRVHAHLTLSNTEHALGGHMEEGCRVLTFCFIALLDTPGASYAEWDRFATPEGFAGGSAGYQNPSPG